MEVHPSKLTKWEIAKRIFEVVATLSAIAGVIGIFLAYGQFKEVARQTKIQNDTDAQTLTTDKQSIVKSYRVYALFMPKIRIIAHADRILEVANEMKAKTTSTDALSKIADAQTQAQNAINAVSPLTPDGYPGNKTTLDSARGMLRTALADLKTARQSMK